MDATIRELNQHTAQVLERVAHGESVTVTKNGQPVAVLRPYGFQDPPVYPFRTDPMGQDENIPTFNGDPDFSERVGDHLVGFGNDD
ncbi:MAG: type II toxin-antitoxin system prevent-host-death family antitoxin [Acidimicrobiales bacterium]|nr:MAG: type II toxin-antitoxin system prevent-host-death family antitoxin [Acidimicrobiales bacterium]